MFPQLIAGPIVRFHEIAAQIRVRSTGLSGFSEGALRFSLGLVKKVVVADSVGEVADAALRGPGRRTACVGSVGRPARLHASDLLRLLGLLGHGHRPGADVRLPLSSRTSTLPVHPPARSQEFWRRWHMTRSRAWFRDYLYIPLGGSRRGSVRTYLNLASVFLLVGLWHGAAWTFVAWGAYHGLLLIAERLSSRRYIESAPRPALARGITLLLVMLGWVLFRADDLPHAARFYAALAGQGSAALQPELLLSLTQPQHGDPVSCQPGVRPAPLLPLRAGARDGQGCLARCRASGPHDLRARLRRAPAHERHLQPLPVFQVLTRAFGDSQRMCGRGESEMRQLLISACFCLFVLAPWLAGLAGVRAEGGGEPSASPSVRSGPSPAGSTPMPTRPWANGSLTCCPLRGPVDRARLLGRLHGARRQPQRAGPDRPRRRAVPRQRAVRRPAPTVRASTWRRFHGWGASCGATRSTSI